MPVDHYVIGRAPGAVVKVQVGSLIAVLAVHGSDVKQLPESWLKTGDRCICICIDHRPSSDSESLQ